MRRSVWYSLLVAVLAVRAAAAVDVSPEKEKELIGILQTGTPGEKAVACKKLAIDGSKAAVPELAKLLPDPQLHSWARTALEAIPGPEANEALRSAAEKLEGRLLIGCINTLGIRRDTEAVAALTKRLDDKDADVAAAAALALGRIGNDDATATLRKALASSKGAQKSAVAEGCILCAERLHAGGKAAGAIEIYDEVRKSDVAKPRILEATRGAILARKTDGIPLLVEQLNSPDRGQFAIGLSTARELAGVEVDRALAAQLENAKPDRAAIIIVAMADRKDTVQLPAIVTAAKSGPREVRLAAIGALARVGDSASVATLIDAAGEGDPGLTEAAKAAIAELPGDKVDAQIVELLAKADAKALPFVIELVGRRRIEATAQLLKALEHSNASVRAAALTALGETVDLKGLPTLIGLVTSPKKADDAEAALTALKTAAVRMPDRDACAVELSKALDKAPATAKGELLDILGEVGGPGALKTVAAAAKSSDVALQDNASRVLGKWNGVDAAPVMLDLAKTGPAAFRTRVLRGYIGLARKFAMPDADRAAMCQAAFDQGKEAEQKLVLDVIKLHPSKETLAIAIKQLKTPDLKDAATEAVLVAAQKLGAKKIDVSAELAKAGLEKVKLEIVKAEYGAGTNQKDVTDTLRKSAGDLPLISLDKGYNATFGGDPAAGQVKQLKVQYKLNGKAGEASYPEDALIIFATPK